MDHLDLAGVLTTPPQWNLPAFEQQDAIYLSSSRQMLEPIMEETSEDEEYALNSWSQYEQQNSDAEGGFNTEGESLCGGTGGAGGASFWSSAESDTGSVIRIEVTKDNDSNSERDFLCPAKRARRCEESLPQTTAEEEVILRRPLFASVEKNNSLERFLNYENFARDSWGASSQQRSSVGSRRGFDDFYSDSDSLSYNSLSRSSSLIQFESLERQLLMQEQHASMNSLGNSSPSLLSFENQEEVANKGNNNSGNNSANNSRRGSQSSLLKKYESLDGRLHQTYYDLDKLNFDDMNAGTRNSNLKLQTHMAELRSDSESSSEGSERSCRPQTVLMSPDEGEEFLFKRFNRAAGQQNKKGKNSAENLSEDSGYCEPAVMGFGLRRSKSQTLLLKNYEKFSEEEEEMENKSLLTNNYKHLVNEEESEESDKHSLEQEYKNGREHNEQLSPHLEFIRHKQRTETHSPSPVSSEVSTSSSLSTNSNNSSASNSSSSTSSSSSSSSTASSTSSATTCASKASFTWLKTSASTKHDRDRDRDRQTAEEEEILPYKISLNDLCELKTSNEENVSIIDGKISLKNLESDNNEILKESEENFELNEKTPEIYCGEIDFDRKKCENELEIQLNTENKTREEQKSGGELTKCLRSEEEVRNIVKEQKQRLLLHKTIEKEFEPCVNSTEYLFLHFPLKNLKLMPNWPYKTCSVPHDLQNIGRPIGTEENHQRATCKQENHSLFPKRSLSWSYFSKRAQEPLPQEAKHLNILHQSYYNLAELVSDSLPQNNMSDKRISSDYETEIVCKNNFLLDELSAHYDRTASILNDQPIDQVDFHEKPPKPLPRLHQRKSSQSSNCSQPEEQEDMEQAQVQHVQLVIRQPPARQKRHTNPEEASKSNSLCQDFQFNSIMPSTAKTFDQDPTILKTSYAQSLEKCNFDCKELSTQDLSKTRSLPKRRFQSQANNAKKKSLVSSTPNLNAYDFQHQDDIEDDMFVSSAHTSMHQLPMGQTQKPLGILLPAGSRTSFGKEVSFCPVVSKYCWQEQSSEECTEGNEDLGGEGEAVQGEEESEDELLDNADATVIYNTKENEMIAAKYNEEYLKKEQQQQQQMDHNKEEAVKEKVIVKELNHKQKAENIRVDKKELNENVRAEEEREIREHETNENETQQILPSQQETTEKQNTKEEEKQMELENRKLNNSKVQLLKKNPVSLATNVNNETLKENVTRDNNGIEKQKQINVNLNTTNNNNNIKKPTVVVARPLSIQLPILSEPPINRAHHILYASQQMLDNFQKQQENEQTQHLKTQSTQNLSKMSQVTRNEGLQQKAPPPVSNTLTLNNNDIMKSKFKHEEKHPNSKGFLSRFANGFRFSLRRNKKKLQKENQNQTEEAQKQVKANTLPANHKPQQQQDIIHIPLKGPLPERQSNKATNGNAAGKSATLAAKQKGAKLNQEIKVTGKPPIPPHQLQQQQKLQSAESSQQQQQPLVEVGFSRFYTESQEFPPHNALSATQDFLLTEQKHNQQYLHNNNNNNNPQSCANHQQDQQFKQNLLTENDEIMSSSVLNTTTTTNNVEFSSPSRATVSQKTQMFNNLSRNHHNPQSQQNHPKIGLIETNLDTHETIITGKTRSLINIGPQQLKQHQQQQRYAGNKRLHGKLNSPTNRHQSYHHHDGHEADNDDDDDVYDDNDDDEVVVRPDGTVVVIKNAGTNGSSTSQSQSTAQIVSVRRPHKSMEFLLDKENQKDVMPPENELQKSHDHNPAALSEHQLRIQASLQRLNIPDWFRQYNQNQKSPDGAVGTYKPGNFTRKRTQESGRWVGLNSKTTSLSSLGSQRSDRSPLLLSPSAHSHHGGQTTATTQHSGPHGHVTVTGSGASGGAFSRWSTSHLNSSQTSPSVSQRGSFSRGGPINSSFISVNSGHSVIRNSMRQPYLGWRSQEKLSQRTAHERLASSLLSQQQQRTSPTSQSGVVTATNDKLQPVTPEIQSSIKEVTSAIVHYVNDQTNQQRSRSTSPNSRKCWLESSFVGTRPLDSPQTPIIENTPLITAAQAAATGGVIATSLSATTLRPTYLTTNNNNNNNINNNNNNLQYANHNVDGSLNLSTLTGNDIQLNRMNGGLNNGTSSSSAVGGVVNLGVGESKRKTHFHLTKIQEC